MGNTKGTKDSFGSLRTLPSGRIQARYTGPDGLSHRAPVTFETMTDARTWLSLMRADITRGKWSPKDKTDTTTFGDYAEEWLAERTLKPRTRILYRQLLDNHLLPTLGDVPLTAITPALVRRWHASTATDKPTTRAHAYGLLRTILGTAVDDELLSANPCHIRGAGSAKRVHRIRPASLTELEAIVTAIPERYRVLVLLAAWCQLRFGESTELRRRDVDLKGGVLRVRRGVVRLPGEYVVDTPKSDAGTRDVTIPPHLIPLLRTHIAEHAAPGRDGLLFPAANGGHLSPSSLYRVYYPARAKAGRSDLLWHDLRHTGAVLAASTGATLADLMARLGHSTPAAALRYQHAAEGKDAVIARRLSDLANGE